ncbi:MAG: tRNA 5-methoxyuridine(34)/uridine 5-oxyacetic acid(34) synthase CmoB [Granulosicoccaceae bacterium]
MFQLSVTGRAAMIDWTRLHSDAREPELKQWLNQLRDSDICSMRTERHGDYPRWRAALDALPSPAQATIDLNRAAPRSVLQQTQQQAEALHENLQGLHPWRKGPFELGGIHIDTEWRSDFKWDRVAPHLHSLKQRQVLDVGSGNGYFCWRIAGAGASLALGIEPSVLFNLQFDACRKLLGQSSAHLLPVGIEAVPRDFGVFDTALSMGVLYHRREPMDHLQHLQQCLRPGGQLLLETLVVPGDVSTVLVPEGRYARMRNVWFLPSAAALCRWLERLGFAEVECVDINTTSLEEQRSTQWMRFESLAECLDAGNPELTIEGLPAPRRAVISAVKK